MKRWAFAVAIVLLAGTWLVLVRFSRAEQLAPEKPLEGFPLKIGAWSGRELAMDDRVLEVLRLSDFVSRVYRLEVVPGSAATDASVPVWLYVGYYASQRTGSTYHSPRNCLPGGGWQMGPIERVTGLIPGRPAAAVNRVLIRKDFERQLILYWYQDRGRIVASEYEAKLNLIWDAMTRNRTDGAFIRISTPVVGSEKEAHARARRLLEASWPVLSERLPG